MDSNTIIVQRDQAVFRLDGDGRWRNAHGPFAHRRIIDRFHRSIRRDEGGYFLTQDNCGRLEKVYFPYEETPLFVFRVVFDDPVRLVLNTGAEIELDPNSLYTHNDALFMATGDEVVKFTSRALMTLAGYVDTREGELVLELDGAAYPIRQDRPAPGPAAEST